MGVQRLDRRRLEQFAGGDVHGRRQRWSCAAVVMCSHVQSCASCHVQSCACAVMCLSILSCAVALPCLSPSVPSFQYHNMLILPSTAQLGPFQATLSPPSTSGTMRTSSRLATTSHPAPTSRFCATQTTSSSSRP